VVGADVKRVKFAHHFILGLCSVGIYLLSGNFWAGLAFAVLVNSGWLLAFHGNVGQVPAALIALGLASGDKNVQIGLWVFALLYEPKLLPAFVVIAITGQWYMVVPITALGIMLFYLLPAKVRGWIWESSVVIPGRMAKHRPKSAEWVPWYTAQGLLYLLPWTMLAVLAKNEALYWLPPALFVLLTAGGKVLRPNHLLPLLAWIAMSGISPLLIVCLVITDWTSQGFYFGDVWARNYPFLRVMNEEAEVIGKWLRDKPGSIWVNGIHSGIYIHARKPVPYGMAEQIEINGVATERRQLMIKKWKENPPDWVVNGENIIQFDGTGYKPVTTLNKWKIWKKVGG
jgi:hypothetical protein